MGVKVWWPHGTGREQEAKRGWCLVSTQLWKRAGGQKGWCLASALHWERAAGQEGLVSGIQAALGESRRPEVGYPRARGLMSYIHTALGKRRPGGVGVRYPHCIGREQEAGSGLVLGIDTALEEQTAGGWLVLGIKTA